MRLGPCGKVEAAAALTFSKSKKQSFCHSPDQPPARPRRLAKTVENLV